VDVAVGRDPCAAHAVDGLDPGHQLAGERRPQDWRGEDGRPLAQGAAPSTLAIQL
jgi:hypothetical protein